MEIIDRIRKAKRVFVIGNGGSYANATHIANDLQACNIRAYTLDPATLTATANDFGYEYVFSKWIILHAETLDLLIALSGSGKSKNILNACEAGEKIGMDVYRLFGAELGQNMQQAEDFQIQWGHEIMRELKQ